MAEVHYEVHILKGERWTIWSAAENAKEAVAEAERRVRRAPGRRVRVVRERLNPRTEQVSARIVFEHRPAERRAEGVLEPEILRGVNGLFDAEPEGFWADPRRRIAALGDDFADRLGEHWLAILALGVAVAAALGAGLAALVV